MALDSVPVLRRLMRRALRSTTMPTACSKRLRLPAPRWRRGLLRERLRAVGLHVRERECRVLFDRLSLDLRLLFTGSIGGDLRRDLELEV